MFLEILTPKPLTSREEGGRVLHLWRSYLPSCLPDKVGNWEPVDQVFHPEDRDAILALWRWPFLAVKSKPKMGARVFMRKGKILQHASWVLSFDYGGVDVKFYPGGVRPAVDPAPHLTGAKPYPHPGEGPSTESPGGGAGGGLGGRK